MFCTGITCELFSSEPDYTCWIELKALVLDHEVAGTRYGCIQKKLLKLSRKRLMVCRLTPLTKQEFDEIALEFSGDLRFAYRCNHQTRGAGRYLL